MHKLTDREISIAAFKYAAVRVCGVVLVIAMNVIAGIKFGYDVRDWEWWAVSPLATIVIIYGMMRLGEAIE